MRWKHKKVFVMVLISCLLGLIITGRHDRGISAAQIAGPELPLQIGATLFPASQAKSPALTMNTCKCDPPIPSQASATGDCSRTQRGGSFCDITFSLSQKAATAIQSSIFKPYAYRFDPQIDTNKIPPLVERFETQAFETQAVENVAAAIKAIAIVAGSQRPNDPITRDNFRDIWEMLTFQGAADLDPKTPVVRSLNRFISEVEGGAQQSEAMAGRSGRTYKLITTSGCITFEEEEFAFTVKAASAGASCERLR